MDPLKCLTSTHLLTLVSLHSSTLIPILSVGDLTSINGIHQWPIIRWWNNMFDLETSIHIVVYVLVVVCVEYFPVWWHSTYATYLIVPVVMIFQLSWLDSSVCQTFPAIVEIMVLCISSSWRFWSIYSLRGDDHRCHILYHAYSWPLYSYVSGTTICTCSHM